MLLFAGLAAGCVVPASEQPSAPCGPPAGVDASPNSLVAVFELIDALPHPVTVECFVESLERPLNIIASTNDFSAQPGETTSPRVLVMYDQFIASWVPSGDGRGRLEFAEERPDGQSVKGELLMPLDGPITTANFEHMLHSGGGGTVCSGCHFDEEPADIGFGEFYQSQALRVAPDEVVSVARLRALHDECDGSRDAERCDIFEAMFGHGAVVDADFPRDLPTVYD